MFFISGAIIVTFSVIGGFVAIGGHLAVLWQPFEFVIICGAALGAFIIANPKTVLFGMGKAFGQILRGPYHTKETYLELLSLLYAIFRLAKSKGMLVLEQHVENPEESELFRKFPKFFADKHALGFVCDYLRMMVLGAENPYEMEPLMDEEIEIHHTEQMTLSDSIRTVGDGLPALGIVAAVLGIIKTMGAISEPPEVLGKLIGGALVGTFVGVLLSYGFVAPMADALKAVYDSETKYYQCIKVGLLAHMQGYAPSVSIEFARKALFSNVRPTFYEVEEAVDALPSFG
ncbi:MAG: flagellar motor stator protein MotA [Proteobacteria bacterium]|nr:flagellar motor stator protein MotA [Pseudomonadota bacterium]